MSLSLRSRNKTNSQKQHWNQGGALWLVYLNIFSPRLDSPCPSIGALPIKRPFRVARDGHTMTNHQATWAAWLFFGLRSLFHLQNLNSDGLQPTSDGLQPTRADFQPTRSLFHLQYLAISCNHVFHGHIFFFHWCSSIEMINPMWEPSSTEGRIQPAADPSLDVWTASLIRPRPQQEAEQIGYSKQSRTQTAKTTWFNQRLQLFGGKSFELLSLGGFFW